MTAESGNPAVRERTGAELRIVGHETVDERVSVDILVRLLEGLQQLSLIFASAKDNRRIRHRFSVTKELRERFRLRCGVPSAGSYVVPLELVDESDGSLLPNDDILPSMFQFIDATATGRNQSAVDLLPDSLHRDRALRTLRSFVPRKGERWSATLAVGADRQVSLNGKLTQHIDRWLSEEFNERAVMTFTGELIAVKFDEYKLVIRHPVSNHELECTYRPELEVNLLESRRDMVQVTGEFTLDGQGQPSKLTNVSQIEAIDLSTMEFENIEYGGRILKAKSILRFNPCLDDETKQLFVLDDESLDLHVFAPTRVELVEELMHHIVFAWDAYAQAGENELTSAAQELRVAYLNRFEETSSAQIET